MNYLVVVGHCDDEAFGCGATIYKLVEQGHRVAVATLCSKAAARSVLSETLSCDQQEAHKILGVTKSYNADFPNIKMNIVPHLDMVKFVEKCIVDFDVEAIITHHPADTNIDHRETSSATQAAFRLFQRTEGLPLMHTLMYMEITASTEWSVDSSAIHFVPNYFHEIGIDGFEKKMEALNAYKNVMKPFPHPSSIEVIKAQAIFRGSQAKCNMAEAYQIVFQRG